MTNPNPPVNQPINTVATTPVIQVLPGTGAPIRSATEEASAAARAAIAATGTALPPTPPAHPSINQPRVAPGVPEGGQFAPDPRRELPNPSEPTPPAAGQPDPGQQPAPTEGQTPAPDPNAPAGQETPEPGAEGEPEENALVVALPGAREGEEFEIQVDSHEAAERLRQLRNSSMRGNEVRAAREDIARQLDEINGVRQMIETDPAGFVADVVLPESPEAADHLVLYTLTQPEVFRRLAPTLKALLTDEREFRTVAAEQKAARAEMTQQAQTRIQEGRIVQQNFRDIQSSVAAMIPSDRADVELVTRDCLRDLKAYADRYNLLTIPVHEVPTILATRLQAIGINPVEAAARAAETAVRNAAAVGPNGRHPAPRAPGSAPITNAGTGGAPTGRPSTPAPNGKRFVASSVARKNAAAPSGGAGSPPGGTPAFTSTKPDGTKMGIQEAVAAHRERVSKGVKSY